ncbi:MAG: flavin oxidoreductase [Candidatus Altiarchaeales archaeon]|nr:flavin oxidoreductase [Candidatus Altiarchaeales archaeon]MBD3415924.1 flavin oxidoreductase [Candidatus Altiarchaeales archaeon]
MDAEGAFEKIVTGIHVITVKAGDKVNGMAAAWVTRVSHSPPLVMVSVAHTRFTHNLIQQAGSFCVNILAEGQDDLVTRFGFKTGKSTDKFDGLPYGTGETGSPILDGTAGYLDCKLISSHEAGDHTIFVGEVVDAKAYDKNPMSHGG